MRAALLLFVLVLVSSSLAGSDRRKAPLGKPKGQYKGTFEVPEDRPGIQNCTVHYYKQTVDHFGYALPTGGNYFFNQRYFVCDPYWKNDGDDKGPIFFYTGNEGDVTLYLNMTGLMWENAAEFGALLVFAEHRYYGESKPFGDETPDNMWYLNTEQALADYAELIFYLKETMNAYDSPVISFGGSYGGMLSSWFRMKYPTAVDGAIAASAPIMAFLGENPATDQFAFNNIVTRDATPYAEASAACSDNIRKSFDVIFDWASTASGRAKLQQAFELCTPPGSHEGGYDLAYYSESAMAYMAMGNYPYPSSYMTNGDGMLPAYPMRVGCDFLSGTYADDDDGNMALLTDVKNMISIFYNATGTESCLNLHASVNAETEYDGNAWDFQWCTELMMPQSQNGVDDMFFEEIFDLKESVIGCEADWDVISRPLWATIEWGAQNIHARSNIVFSNGDYDPWSGSGVLESISDSLVAIVIPGSAHHLDLFWSNEADPPAVTEARKMEKSYIYQWIQEAKMKNVPLPMLTKDLE